MTIPNGMPVLSAGAHAKPSDGACLMEYVSLLAGESWSDHPACTHPVLAAAARVINDRLDDGNRHLLIPLIGRLMGTAGPVDDDALILWCKQWALAAARSAEHLHPAAKACNDVTEQYLAGQALKAVLRTYAANATADATAANAAKVAAYASYAAAYTASTAAKVVTYAAIDAEPLIQFLAGLIGEYDRLSNRLSAHAVTETELRMILADAVSGRS